MLVLQRCRCAVLIRRSTVDLRVNASQPLSEKPATQEPQRLLELEKAVSKLRNTGSAFMDYPGLKQRLLLQIHATTATVREKGYLKALIHYLEEVSHFDDVRKAQQHVMYIKNQLRETGDQKRAILQQLANVRNDLHHVYREIKFTDNRASGQYLELVKEEVNLYTREKDLQEAFVAADAHEQYLFNAFTVAINDSYEKEKLHTSFIRYISIIKGIIGTIVALIGYSIAIKGQGSKVHEPEDVEKKVDINKLAKDVQEIKKSMMPPRQDERESWGPYLKRHTRWMYSWATSKKSQ